MKFINNEKGVTMLVLVVTAVVMLILAGVSIGFATNNNGILARSGELKEKTVAKERMENQIMKNVIASVSDDDKVISTGETKEDVLFDTSIYAYLMDSDSDGAADTLVLSGTDSSKFDLGSFGKIKGNYGSELYDSATNKPNWESEKQNIERVIVRTNIIPTKCNDWFMGCTNLKAIRNLNYINTKNITDMSYMFQGCEKLQTIDVSLFVTDNVTDMRGMFNGCKAVTKLDLSNFRTSNVQNMDDMFNGCEKSSEILVPAFDTTAVLSMKRMFKDCKSVVMLTLKTFNNKGVELNGCTEMFAGDSNLTAIYVTGVNFNTGYATMFDNDSGTTTCTIY